MTRWKAFALHLLLSLIVIGGVAFGLFYLWYPPHLLGFAKADTLFALIAGIDIVAGPLLTLVVYKAGKKSLRFDLAVIGFAQIAFLVAGLWTVWQSRPVFLVAAFDRYELIFANEIEPEDLALGADNRRTLPLFGAELVALRRPTSDQELFSAMEAAQAGRDLAKRPEYYLPIADGTAEILAKSHAPSDLEPYVPMVGVLLVERAESMASELGDHRVVPITSARGSALVLIDPTTGFPVRSLY